VTDVLVVANGCVRCVSTVYILNIAGMSRGHADIGNVSGVGMKVRSVVRCMRATVVFSLIRRHVLSRFACIN
jgi:hypothetical protein